MILLQECVLHLQDKLANAKDRANAAEECKLMLDEQMKVIMLIYSNEFSHDCKMVHPIVPWSV